MPAYDTGTYEFAADAGVDSIDALTELVRSSGIGFTVVAGFQLRANSWHNQHNAIDVASTQAEMVTIGDYLLQYGEYLLELIHTNPDGSGQYAKNGKIVDQSAYNAVQVAQHRSIIHVAGTLSGMQAAARATEIWKEHESQMKRWDGLNPHRVKER